MDKVSNIVSIVIIAYNQEKYLLKSLPIIKNQITEFNYEIIGVVTESKDNTEKLCEKYCSKIIKIKKENFHHSKTRNLAIRECKGEFIVFLVGDAIPYDELWLQNLVAPLIEDKSVVGSYSKQIPFENSPIWEKNDIEVGCKNAESLKIRSFGSFIPNEKEITKYISFSNVSACYRGEIIKKYNFNENLTSCEDKEWCKRMLENGYKIVFCPTSIVIHSHNHSLKETIRRNYEFGKNFAKFLNKNQLWVYRNLFILCSYIGYKILKDLVFLFKNKHKGSKFIWVIKVIVFRILEKFSFYKGVKFTWRTQKKKY